MAAKMQVLDRAVIRVSPHLAAAFRERMQSILSEMPRMRCNNSATGFFEAEIVRKIFTEARLILSQLKIDIDLSQIEE